MANRSISDTELSRIVQFWCEYTYFAVFLSVYPIASPIASPIDMKSINPFEILLVDFFFRIISFLNSVSLVLVSIWLRFAVDFATSKTKFIYLLLKTLNLGNLNLRLFCYSKFILPTVLVTRRGLPIYIISYIWKYRNFLHFECRKLDCSWAGKSPSGSSKFLCCMWILLRPAPRLIALCLRRLNFVSSWSESNISSWNWIEIHSWFLAQFYLHSWQYEN